MKILVCISKTPDTKAKIAFTDNNTKFATEGIQWILNPTDEWYALVKAIELKEKDPTTTIHLIMVGTAEADPLIRKALALGGEEAIRIDLQPQDALETAASIAAVAREGNYDLILTGKETIDFNGGAVGGMIAGFLDYPYISFATQLQVENNRAQFQHKTDEGLASSEAALPLVISCQKGMAEQRIPNMKGIMSARTKPLHVVNPSTQQSTTQWIDFSLPATKAGVHLVPADQPAELVRLLHEEAKVI